MYHHDDRSYPEAASEAAAKGRIKMEEMIQQALSRGTAQAVLTQIETQIPRDRMVPSHLLSVAPRGGDGYALQLPGDETWYPLHEHALGQICEKAGMPNRYLRELGVRGDWGRELAAENLDRLLSHQKTRNLIRVVGGDGAAEVRGFLSDRFRRLDSRPLVEAFCEACQAVGAVPVEGFGLDTKVRLRAVMPKVFEPAPHEVMLFGVEWGNSDFGDGGHTLKLWNQRVWCTNNAVLDEALRQVHLGGRIPEDVRLSERTMQLDAQTNASALQDVVSEYLGPQRIAGYLEKIREAVAVKLDEQDVTRLLKKELTESELVRVQNVFGHPDGQFVPAGASRYSLANAISWIAQAAGTNRRRELELQEVAGRVMGPVLDRRDGKKV